MLVDSLWVLLSAATSVALLAFGWVPCCCPNYGGCCPGLTSNLSAIMSVPSCGCMDGLTATFTYDGAHHYWTGSFTSSCPSGTTSSLTLSCDSGTGLWGFTAFEIGSCVLTYYARTQTSLTCSPFQLVISGTVGFPTSTCTCNGAAFTITFTVAP